MIGKILLLLMLADVLICIFSFLDAIPLGKSWMAGTGGIGADADSDSAAPQDVLL